MKKPHILDPDMNSPLVAHSVILKQDTDTTTVSDCSYFPQNIKLQALLGKNGATLEFNPATYCCFL